MKIQFSDLSLQHKIIKREIYSALNKLLKRNDFILGEDVALFENEFAKYCSVKYAVGVSSGTAALFLTLKSLGIKEGDEVIVPAFTYIATAFAVSYTGAKLAFVDIDEKTYNINARKISAAITKNTKAIIPVHLYGQPADMDAILKVAKENNLKVIEDAAQAHGAAIKMKDGVWRKAGTIADAGAFSFYPSKNLGAMGDGGMVTTNNEEIYKNLLMLRDYGRISRYEHAIIGYNSRLDTLQASILRLKLKHLDSWNRMRRNAASLYDKLLKGKTGVITPSSIANVKHVYHVYAIRVKNKTRLIEEFKENEITAIVHYPLPLHLQKAYSALGYQRGDFPAAEEVSSGIISIPIFPYIKERQINKVSEIIKLHSAK